MKKKNEDQMMMFSFEVDPEKDTMKRGKHEGLTYAAIAKKDPGYIVWLVDASVKFKGSRFPHDFEEDCREAAGEEWFNAIYKKGKLPSTYAGSSDGSFNVNPVIHRIPFGDCKGRLYLEIARLDPQYILWLKHDSGANPSFQDGFIRGCKMKLQQEATQP